MPASGRALTAAPRSEVARGERGRTHVYGIANLYYDFLAGSETDVAGTFLVHRVDPF
jgi:hypothetical protein